MFCNHTLLVGIIELKSVCGCGCGCGWVGVCVWVWVCCVCVSITIPNPPPEVGSTRFEAGLTNPAASVNAVIRFNAKMSS